MLKITVKHNGVTVRFSVPKRRMSGPLMLANYTQQDSFSCGFVAALTVARYLTTTVKPVEVLRAIDLDPDVGVDRQQMVRALRTIGIKATYRDNLRVADLMRYAEGGVPVMVSVWPDEWRDDHWTVVQKVDINRGRVYLTNHYNMDVSDFKREWIDNWEEPGVTRGAGLVCAAL